LFSFSLILLKIDAENTYSNFTYIFSFLCVSLCINVTDFLIWIVNFNDLSRFTRQNISFVGIVYFVQKRVEWTQFYQLKRLNTLQLLQLYNFGVLKKTFLFSFALVCLLLVYYSTALFYHDIYFLFFTKFFNSRYYYFNNVTIVNGVSLPSQPDKRNC